MIRVKTIMELTNTLKKNSLTGNRKRKTFVIDALTERDIQYIRKRVRASTSSEAIRYSVRRTVEILKIIATGGKLKIETSKGKSIQLDFPG